MEMIKTHKALFATLLLTVLYALHYGLPLYATSTFLKSVGFSTPFVSLLYGLSSLLTLIFSNHIAKYLKTYHSYQFTFAIVLAKIMATIAMVTTQSSYLIAVFFVIHFVLNSIIFVLLNIFVENFTPKHKTGIVRGLFLTLFNVCIMVSPLLGGLILQSGGFKMLYISSSLLLIPGFYLLHHYLREMKDEGFESHSLMQALRKILRNKDLRGAVWAQLALNAFYIVMVIYTPLYVIDMLHISLVTYLTVLAPIVLIPLVLLPYELGYLADEKYGEKEFMILGLSILGICSFLLGVIHFTSLLSVIVVLFISRIGAALVETMAYTYYYQKISKADPAMTNLFTNITVFASCVVPLFLFLIAPLLYIHEGLVFILLSLFAFSVIQSVLHMKDTR